MKIKEPTAIKWAIYYWVGALLQIGMVCGITALFKARQIQQGVVISVLLLAIGGLSTAFWGVMISKRSKKVSSYKQVVFDFFNMKQPIRLYLLVLGFLGILFGKQILLGEFQGHIKVYMFFSIFIQAILFGGIEEIGWRYTFQPIMEEHMAFEGASIITFISWGIWHYLYFYMTGTIHTIQHASFLIGLLGSCFILGALYKVGKSLWICVLYHALLNMFSQTLLPTTLFQTLLINGIGIILAIIIVKKKRSIGVEESLTMNSNE